MRERVVYGYGTENGAVSINAGEKETIQRVFDDYISGKSIRQVMQALNEDPERESVDAPGGRQPSRGEAVPWRHRISCNHF